MPRMQILTAAELKASTPRRVSVTRNARRFFVSLKASPICLPPSGVQPIGSVWF